MLACSGTAASTPQIQPLVTPPPPAASHLISLQRAHWHAHDGAISSVNVIPSRPVSGYSNAGSITSVPYDPNNPTLIPPLIVSGSRDSNVTVWTLDGGLVGVLGEHSWDLDHQETWQDPEGLRKRPPKPESDGMYLKVRHVGGWLSQLGGLLLHG